MINKNFENIKVEDITQLIENGVPESKTIEYKLKLNDDHAPWSYPQKSYSGF